MDTSYTRRSFDEELQEMKRDILRMGSVVEEMLAGSVEALRTRNPVLAEEVIAKDDVVDEYNLTIEQRCLGLLALQQPMARDLRTIAAALYIIKDVERMGDYALDIAKAARKLAPLDPIRQIEKIPQMAQIVQRMLHESLQAFVNRDIEAVCEVARQDDEVDAIYRLVRDELIAQMQADPTVALRAVELILSARYLERIADHITNVGERIAYMETGEMKEFHS